MKKFILLVILFVIAGFLAYKLLSDKPARPAEPADKPLAISKNSGAFDAAFGILMNDYFAMRDALVNWDTLKADQAAYALAGKADSLPVNLMKADTNIILTARSLAASLSGDAKGFVGEAGIEGRRQSFNILTEELYNLVRAVRYDGETTYHLRCPMAFKDSIEGFWLSNSREIVNPYLGNKHPGYGQKMLHCGDIVDSFLAK
ncbi:DUF3347 domain-containing protein [Puia dinghuensis]|uniref:DUF3347 domain-containing protein n=1 Tax=Puia dinghuensis TaxID=1792502 RepID=A0A8J2U8U5_9BACT|nr:DUF3347 domain-containing protein [Puia dinghuensis]GGA86147.1 hypothetical protein GCM10011511_06500 [Puia dinghuensis]